MTPELQTIARALRDLPPDDEAVLLTLVDTEGSTYRRPGARMLYLPSGHLLGAISGGCLREDLAVHARTLLQSTERYRLLSYCSWEVADEVLGLGLGCEGTYTVFLERCTSSHPLAHHAPTILAGQEAFLALVTASQEPSFPTGETVLFFPDSETLAGSPTLWKELARYHVPEASQTQYIPLTHPHLTLYLERLSPPLSLHIFGAGEDARPLTQLASQLGWMCEVYDFRPDLLSQKRFPTAHSLHVVPLEEPPSSWKIIDRKPTAAVVMSHHLRFDRLALQALLPREIPYIGLLGPRSRTHRLLETLPPRLRTRAEKVLFNPAGLDIGAETPEEIALCIVAEIRAFHANRRGGFLRNRTGSIHATPSPAM